MAQENSVSIGYRSWIPEMRKAASYISNNCRADKAFLQMLPLLIPGHNAKSYFCFLDGVTEIQGG